MAGGFKDELVLGVGAPGAFKLEETQLLLGAVTAIGPAVGLGGFKDKGVGFGKDETLTDRASWGN